MARKYIERNRTQDDDEPERSLGARLEIEDSLDAQDRNISFSKYERPLTTTELTQAMVKELTNTVQDTGQYIQDVKTHMNKQMSTINKSRRRKRNLTGS